MKLLVSRLGNSDHDLSISEGPRLKSRLGGIGILRR